MDEPMRYHLAHTRQNKQDRETKTLCGTVGILPVNTKAERNKGAYATRRAARTTSCHYSDAGFTHGNPVPVDI